MSGDRRPDLDITRLLLSFPAIFLFVRSTKGRVAIQLLFGVHSFSTLPSSWFAAFWLSRATLKNTSFGLLIGRSQSLLPASGSFARRRVRIFVIYRPLPTNHSRDKPRPSREPQASLRFSSGSVCAPSPKLCVAREFLFPPILVSWGFPRLLTGTAETGLLFVDPPSLPSSYRTILQPRARLGDEHTEVIFVIFPSLS